MYVFEIPPIYESTTVLNCSLKWILILKVVYNYGSKNAHIPGFNFFFLNICVFAIERLTVITTVILRILN